MTARITRGTWVNRVLIFGAAFAALTVFAAIGLPATSASANVLSNPDFNTVGPSGPSTSFTGNGGAGNSAAANWTLFNNGPATIKTEILPSTRVPGGRMIHVRTTGSDSGLVQVWGAINTGPAHVISSAWVFVQSGKIYIGTGNGGNTGPNGYSSATGKWEQIRGANKVCPANETIVYSAGGPADFYVDFAEVTPVQGPPCPTTGKGKPDLVVRAFGLKEWGKCAPHNAVFTFQVTVANIGTAPSPAIPGKALVQAMDQHGNGWGNGVALGAIPPGGSQTVLIPVYYLQADPAHMTAAAPHPFQAIADPLGLVDEANETNNKWAGSPSPIMVGAPPGCPKP